MCFFLALLVGTFLCGVQSNLHDDRRWRFVCVCGWVGNKHYNVIWRFLPHALRGHFSWRHFRLAFFFSRIYSRGRVFVFNLISTRTVGGDVWVTRTTMWSGLFCHMPSEREWNDSWLSCDIEVIILVQVFFVVSYPEATCRCSTVEVRLQEMCQRIAQQMASRQAFP